MRVVRVVRLCNWADARRGGMTLIEVLVALLILLLVGAGISRVLASAWQSDYTVRMQNEAQKRAQQAIDAVVDSLRGASSAAAISTPHEVAANFPPESAFSYLRYYLQDGNLVRDASGAAGTSTTTVCRRVPNLTVGYYQYADGAWVTPSTPDKVQSLSISITVDVDGYRATEASWVRLRNHA